MYLKEVKDKHSYDVLKHGTCMGCGILPIFKSELESDCVSTTISFTENPGWVFKIDVEKQRTEYCYCPLCARKMKILKLKEKI